MRNFYKCGSDLQVQHLMLALHRLNKSSGIWKEDTYLRKFPQGPFGDVDSVILRFPTRTTAETEEALAGELKNFDQHECHDTEAFKKLPEARPLIFALMNFAQGERLGRVIINRIHPGGQISRHTDTEAHAAYYDRFHVVLKASPGVTFRCGGEELQARTGDAFWFDNSQEHEVINNSGDDRVHLVVDIRTSK